MRGRKMHNTLLLGNGFVRAAYKDVHGWKNLYEKEKITYSFDNLTFLYEAHLLNGNKSDNQFKREIVDVLRNDVCMDHLRQGTNQLRKFGSLLKQNDIHDIITTNYDKGIENILCEVNGYTELWPDDIDRESGEKVYNIRRCIRLTDGEHEVRLWKMHGDIDHIASLFLGFDQYCGAISKMNNYLKGEYCSSSGLECRRTIAQKCRDYEKDPWDGKDCFSWIDLFFNTNLYMAGFGMDFSETDIWWLINKRRRLIKQNIPISNKIYFLYNSHDTGELEKSDKQRDLLDEKMALLQAFGVDCDKIGWDENCITEIFKYINNKTNVGRN